jgi:hypothetical protein
MKIETIEGATRTLGESQGYLPLPIRDFPIEVEPGQSVHGMVSQWRPSADDLELLSMGQPIHLTVMGSAHPPVILTVAPIIP